MRRQSLCNSSTSAVCRTHWPSGFSSQYRVPLLRRLTDTKPSSCSHRTRPQRRPRIQWPLVDAAIDLENSTPPCIMVVSVMRTQNDRKFMQHRLQQSRHLPATRPTTTGLRTGFGDTAPPVRAPAEYRRPRDMEPTTPAAARSSGQRLGPVSAAAQPPRTGPEPLERAAISHRLSKQAGIFVDRRPSRAIPSS